MEKLSLKENQPRVKFAVKYKGTLEDFLKIHPTGRKSFENTCFKLRDALWDLEYYGVTPILPDGKIGGNGGAVLQVGNEEFLLLSKSGKESQELMDVYKDFVIVTSLDISTWTCEYYSSSPEVKPTSDAPLYHAALIQSRSLRWSSFPTYMLHGHAFETEEAAHRMHIPISCKATLFSTREDSEALLDLMREVPFPESKIYIRKDHGFVLLGHNSEDAWDCFRKCLRPHLNGAVYKGFLMYTVLKYLPLLLYTAYRQR